MTKEKSWPESSSIDSANYDEENSILTIAFKGVNVYEYYGVPLELWEEILLTPSIGKFFYREIKGKFEYKKING